MSLTSYAKDGILTVVFDDARILDEIKLEEVGKDLQEMLNKTTEERVILDFRNVNLCPRRCSASSCRLIRSAVSLK